MPNYDGYVRIGVDLDDSQATKAAANLASKLNRQLESLSDTEEKISRLKESLRQIADRETTPNSILNMENALKRAEKESNNLRAQLDALKEQIAYKTELNVGGNYDSDIARLKQQLEEMYEKFGEAQVRAEQLALELSALKADPSTSKEAREIAAKLGEASNKAERLRADIDNTKQQMGGLGESAGEVEEEFKKTSRTTSDISRKISRMAKTAFILYGFRRLFASIRKGFMGLSGFSAVSSVFSDFSSKVQQAYMKNEQLRNALASLKGALYNAFAPLQATVIPLLVRFVNWLARAVSYIAALLSAISGKSMSDSNASAEQLANSVGDVAGNAKEANKQLAGFDKLNNLTENKGGGGGGGGIAPNFDIDGLNPDTLQKFYEIGEKIRGVLEKIGEWWRKANPAAKLGIIIGIIALLTAALSLIFGWPLAIIAGISALVIAVFAYWDDISAWWKTNVAPIFTQAWWESNVWNPIGDWLLRVIERFSNWCSNIWATARVWLNNILDVVNNAKEKWSTAWNGFKQIVTNIWDGIVNAVKGAINRCLAGIENFINWAFSGINTILDGINKAAAWLGMDQLTLQIGAVSLPRLADGGFPTTGSMFIAGEAGPELVGSFGSHNNAVVNEAQLVQAFQSATATQTKLLSQQNSLLQAILEKSGTVTFAPSASAGRVFSQSINMYSRAMG